MPTDVAPWLVYSERVVRSVDIGGNARRIQWTHDTLSHVRGRKIASADCASRRGYDVQPTAAEQIRSRHDVR